MNKKAIWLTIGLMGLALLSILALQFYWISWSVRLNEKQFDDSVIATLKRVSDMLQKEPENAEMYYLDKILEDNRSGIHPMKQMLEYAGKLFQGNNKFSDSLISKRFKHELDPWEMELKLLEAYDRKIRINPISLDQRINPNKLTNLLKHEFDELHLNLNYDFGVFDNELK
ncbi:MAG: hypothetical protein HOP11_13185, partial [Saprospiraceae bacterium]|nr:hypothetical protein [Saprospiraceae bacterium]